MSKVERQHVKSQRQRYREASRRLYPDACITEQAHVQVSIDDDGAFVEVVVWIPKSALEDEGA